MTPQMRAFLTGSAWPVDGLEPIAQDSSARRYFRVRRADETAVLMVAPPQEVDAFRQFMDVARWLRAQGLSAPQTYAEQEDWGLMLLEDFGTIVMALRARKDPTSEREMYEETTRALGHLAHHEPMPGLPVLDAARLTEQAGLLFDEMPNRPSAAIQEEWSAALHSVLSRDLAPPSVLALRDLHAENVMWLADRPGMARVGLLDFQDAVLAPPGYDLASLIDDPRRVVPQTLRNDLILQHAEALEQTPEALAHQVDLLSLARNLRILGIFRRVARLRDKPSYLEFLPRTGKLIARASKAVPELQAQIAWVLAAYGLTQDPVP